jgi:hypothetical protein
MAHRSKHRRANWTPEREAKTLEREEGNQPTPKAKQRRQHRVLPVSVFLRTRVYR